MLRFQVNESIVEKSQPIGTGLFEKLQRDIILGNIKTKSKLTEQEICDKYNVSRTPVRDAIKQLAKDGLVELIPNRGAFVRGFSAQDFSDMQVLRTIYEVKATEWAIERITREEFADLEETFEFMEFYTKRVDAEKMANINMSFHQLIYESSHNHMLSKVLSTYQIYSKYYNISRIHNQDYLEILLEEHRQIFEAFKARDVLAGRRAMLNHMQNSMLRCNNSKFRGGKDVEN